MKYHIRTSKYFIVCLSEESFVNFWAVPWGKGEEKIVTNCDKGKKESKNVIFVVTSFLIEP